MRLRIQTVGPREPIAFSVLATQLLDAISSYNREIIRNGLVPPLYQSGVRYQVEPDNADSFACALTTFRRGWGDCAHLCAWRVAELLESGEPATLRITYVPRKPGRPRDFHVQVRRADGTWEDPSRLLGMGAKQW